MVTNSLPLVIHVCHIEVFSKSKIKKRSNRNNQILCNFNVSACLQYKIQKSAALSVCEKRDSPVTPVAPTSPDRPVLQQFTLQMRAFKDSLICISSPYWRGRSPYIAPWGSVSWTLVWTHSVHSFFAACYSSTMYNLVIEKQYCK